MEMAKFSFSKSNCQKNKRKYLSAPETLTSVRVDAIIRQPYYLICLEVYYESS